MSPFVGYQTEKTYVVKTVGIAFFEAGFRQTPVDPMPKSAPFRTQIKRPPLRAAYLLILRAGHGIRTRDFDLGNLVVD